MSNYFLDFFLPPDLDFLSLDLLSFFLSLDLPLLPLVYRGGINFNPVGEYISKFLFGTDAGCTKELLFRQSLSYTVLSRDLMGAEGKWSG